MWEAHIFVLPVKVEEEEEHEAGARTAKTWRCP